MSGSGHFCPRCGEPIDPDGGIAPPDARGSSQASLCADCYLDAVELVSVPEEVIVNVCSSCGAVRRGETWEDVGAKDYTDIAIDAVTERLQVHRDARDIQWTVEPEHRGPNEIDMLCTVQAKVQGVPVRTEETVSVRISRGTCSRCGRMAGDYYAGTIQVRAAGREPTETETERAVEIAHDIVGETDDRNAFVSEVIDRPEGVDIRVSTNQMGAAIASQVTTELGGSYESSETLVTEDEEGEGVYRVAFAVRLPRFTPGEIIEPDDGAGPVLVVHQAGDVRGRRLASGEEVRLPAEEVEDARRLGTTEDATETTIVTVEDDRAVQVLDPETAAAVTIPRPHDLPSEADTVHVFKSRSGLHAIPEAAFEEVSP